MKHPIALAPLFRPFPPIVLPQTLQYIAVELAVDGLAPGDDFTVNNPANDEENDEHARGRADDLSCLLRSWRRWARPLRGLLVGLRVVPIDPSLVPVDDPRHEGWVSQGTLEEICLIGGQKPGHERFSNVVHVQIRVLGLPALFRMTHQRWKQCR